MIWDWQYAWEVFPDIVVDGLRITLLATVLGSALAYALGLLLTLLRRSPIRLVSSTAWAFIELVRSTPLLVQIFFFFFVLPDFGVRFDPRPSQRFGLLRLHLAVKLDAPDGLLSDTERLDRAARCPREHGEARGAGRDLVEVGAEGAKFRLKPFE